MKNIVSIFALFILTFVSTMSVFAQDSTVVAFVNSDRKQILQYQQYSAAPKVLLQSSATIKTSHLAVLAATPDGKSLFIGGRIVFPNPIDASADSVQGFFRLDLPFTMSSVVSLDRRNIGGIKVLKEAWIPVMKPLPLGTLNGDGTRWYGIWAKTAGSNTFTLYHGNFDGSGTVDTFNITGSYLPADFYQTTNLCVSPGSDIMLFGVMDKLSALDDRQQRLQIFRWRPRPGFEAPLQVTDVTSQLENRRPNHNIDSFFSCVLRIMPGSGTTAELGLAFDDAGNWNFHTFNYTAATLNLTQSGRTVPRSCIPDSVYFFCGFAGVNMQSEADDRETTSFMQRYNNGGDMMFSPSGDTVIFITCSGDGSINPTRTGIWQYALGTGQAQLLWNDPAKNERQPIWLGKKPYVAPPPPLPGTIVITPSPLDFDAVYDSVEVGKSVSLKITVSNPTDRSVKINSLNFSGSNEFSAIGVNPPVTIPFTLAGETSIEITIQFAPTSPGHKSASATIKFADSPDSSRTVIFHGTGWKETIIESVNDKQPVDFNVTISPNPVRSKTHISITSEKPLSYGVTLVDALGKDIDLSALPYHYFRAGAADYEIDADALGLASGTYYLIVTSGSQRLTRQIVITR